MARFSKEKDKGLETFGKGYPTPLLKEVLDSVAYKVLAPMEKLILADMFRGYYRLTNWDRLRLPDGMIFTWTQCQEIVSERAFQCAVRRICHNGFFCAPPEIQEHRPCAPRRYRASTKWRNYQPTDREAKRLARYLEAKTARTKVKRDRRRRFRENLPEADSTPRKCADMTGKIVADTSDTKPSPPVKIVADTCRKNAGLARQKSSRSSISMGLGLHTEAFWQLFDQDRHQTDLVPCTQGVFNLENARPSRV